MGATALAPDRVECRRRLLAQSDEQIDAWATEAMRDISTRRGVLAVPHDLREVTGLADRELEKVRLPAGARRPSSAATPRVA